MPDGKIAVPACRRVACFSTAETGVGKFIFKWMGKTMETYQKDQMRILIHLQNLELEYGRTETMLKAIPARIDALDEELNLYARTLQEREAAYEELRKKYKENEQQIKEEEEKIKKTNGKLFSIKNNKEYQAALKEIEDVRSRISVVEDQLLAWLEGMETDKKSIAGEKEAFNKLKDRIDGEKRGLEAEKNQHTEKLAGLEEEKKNARIGVAAELIGRYQSIKNRGIAIAVAPVADAICQGCHRKIPPQRYNEIQRCDTLSFCPHCSRILYWENGL
jgi:uncharacterized protein